MPARMHAFDDDLRPFAQAVVDFALARVEADASPGGLPLGAPASPEELDRRVGRPTVTAAGLGPEETLRLFSDILEPACLSTDHPGFLAFVPQAPSEVAVLADLVTSACSIYAGSWLEGSGAVWAENQALRWIADLAGLPETAGGVFVQGGTNGNLSALVAAREAASHRRRIAGQTPRPAGGWAILCGEHAHASVSEMAAVMDCDVITVPGQRLTGDAVHPELRDHAGRIAAVVATAGSTNLGRIDDLASVADVCAHTGVWLHVDGAYGLAALAAPSVRDRFAGIERCDSLIVDPHKWLFSPFDSCALLYRDPRQGRAAHTQKASYLEVLTSSGDHNPSDYAVQLSRRARGLPLWFALAAHGTDTFTQAIEHTIDLARQAAELIRSHPRLRLLEEPELSIVAFTRDGWGEADYARWSTELREAGTAFVVPSAHAGEPILRLGIINPRTTVALIERILSTL